MIKRAKKQILELISTVEEANRYLDMLLKQKRTEELQQLLSDEQEAVISIGNQIEEDGEETNTVRKLEEYCEVLWQLSQSTDIKEQELHLADLKYRLTQIRDEISEFVEQYEIVFLPYKASMWDCMETVWEAANRDPSCKAYVIPIPYFDLKADGSRGELHYEAALFPDYIPITSFKQYSLKDRHPNIIYIHNPYDGCNRVTRVPEEFYSSTIHNYTDRLVYIPYFMTAGHMPQSHSYLPAYLYADKIILQNDRMVKEIDARVPKEKLLSLGSPKAEYLKILQKQREEHSLQGIPKAWEEKIGNKKVVLFNVSISGILENSKYAMDKIRYVVSKFEERNDIILLWRPHPLIEATLKSMRPNLWREFKQIKDEFIRKEIGILDETGDAALAAVVADAYIGENTSSLIHYFGVLGKPIYYLNWKKAEEWSEEERASLFFSDCWFEDNYAWFVPRSSIAYNCLCKLQLDTGEVTIEAKLPGEIANSAKGSAYFGIVKLGDYFILSPVRTNDIYIYNISNRQAIKIPLEYIDKSPKFSRPFVYKGKVFLQPRAYPEIIEVNIQEKSVVHHPILCWTEENLLGMGSCIIENKWYIPYTNRNAILVFDMDTGEQEIRCIEGITSGINSLADSDGLLWAIGNQTEEIVCWNPMTGETKIWDTFPHGFVGGTQPFREIVEMDDSMLIFPENANMILKIDKVSGEISKQRIQNEYKEGERKLPACSWMPNYLMAKKYHEKIYAFSTYNNGLLVYNDKTESSTLYQCKLGKEELFDLECIEMDRQVKACSAPNFVCENPRWNLTVFLNYVATNNVLYSDKMQEDYEGVMKNIHSGCGNVIHQTIKNECRKQ